MPKAVLSPSSRLRQMRWQKVVLLPVIAPGPVCEARHREHPIRAIGPVKSHACLVFLLHTATHLRDVPCVSLGA